MASLQALEQQISVGPSLVKDYISKSTEDPDTLRTINQAILNIFDRTGDPNHCLNQCHMMAVSAQRHLVQNMYAVIVPYMLRSKKHNRQFLQYLRTWVQMYPGKWRYSAYPNFASKYQNLVKNVDVPIDLRGTFKEFESNTNKNLNQNQVQFFEDTLVSEKGTQRQMVIEQPPRKDNFDQLIKIKMKLSQNPADIEPWITKLYRFRDAYQQPTQLNNQSAVWLNQQLRWIQLYLNKYEQLKPRGNWGNSLHTYFRQLHQLTPTNLGRVNESTPPRFVVAQENSVNEVRKQSSFKGKSSFFNNSKQFSNSPYGRIDTSGLGMQKEHLIVNKHVPTIVDSPDTKINRSKHRIFADSNSAIKDQAYFRVDNYANQMMAKSMKLSEFSQKKGTLKDQDIVKDLDSAPEWMVEPYLRLFTSDSLFSRFKKSCFLNQSTMLKSKVLEVECRKSRTSATTINFSIAYKNMSNVPLSVNACYKVARECFQVQPHKKIRSRMAISTDETHQFTLVLKQLPLKICTLQLAFGDSIVIPLPLTILDFVSTQPISQQSFLLQWNAFNSANYSVSKKICYNQVVVTSNDISQLIPNLVSIGKTQNYSYQQFGCKCGFGCYDIEFMVTFAFNNYTCVTIEVVSCTDIDSERAEFIDYYLSVLIMLIEKRQSS